MRGDGVEVVAFRSDDGTRDGASGAPNGGSASSNRRAATPLDDSAAALATRFREVRDSLNAEVARLDTVDRRTRAYAVRYAEIRRRTVAAEQLRARRDSVQARAAAQRRESASAGAAGASSTVDSLPALDRTSDVRRGSTRDSVVVLELAPGRWSVAATRDGHQVSALTTVLVASAGNDTLRLRPGMRRSDIP